MVSQSSSYTVDNNTDLATWVRQLRQELLHAGHRAGLVLCGEPDWCVERAHAVLTCFNDDEPVIHVSDHIAQAVPMKKATTRLGREYHAILFDARDGFNPDAFGAISGTLCGGGLLLLLLGNQGAQQSGSRFMQRALPIMQSHAAVYVLERGTLLPDIADTRAPVDHEPNMEAPFRSLDQQQVVEAIENNVRQGLPRPLVLESDRGRGKSSALGLAAGRLMRAGDRRILVTAPRLSTSEPVFHHAGTMLPEAESGRGRLNYRNASLRFVAPDALLLDKPPADILLVDEAAAIPLSLLADFLRHYPACVFATTVHGYEGTGRGFALKFRRILDEQAPGWQSFNMHTPIRWSRNDPLEHWVDRVLCLDAESDDVTDMEDIQADQCRVQGVDRDALIRREQKLSSVFALLVSAHYRTRPSDLKYMLDEANVRLYTLEYGDRVVGALLVNREGGFDAELARAIYRGERRPAGHLLAQTLSFHGGSEAAARLSYARIMRIAVHVQLQGRGLGSLLLEQVLELERQQEPDAVGTSFGATRELVDFWRRAGFELVRMGFSRDHASGTHAAVMMRPFSPMGERVFGEVRERFRRHLHVWLQGPLMDVSEAMKTCLQRDMTTDGEELSDADWLDIRSFAHSHRGVETCLWPLRKLVNRQGALLQNLPEAERRVIQARIVDDRSWPEVVASSGAVGKDRAIVLLRRGIARLVELLQP